jgi:hypothetical protein
MFTYAQFMEQWSWPIMGRADVEEWPARIVYAASQAAAEPDTNPERARVEAWLREEATRGHPVAIDALCAFGAPALLPFFTALLPVARGPGAAALARALRRGGWDDDAACAHLAALAAARAVGMEEVIELGSARGAVARAALLDALWVETGTTRMHAAASLLVVVGVIPERSVAFEQASALQSYLGGAHAAPRRHALSLLERWEAGELEALAPLTGPLSPATRGAAYEAFRVAFMAGSGDAAQALGALEGGDRLWPLWRCFELLARGEPLAPGLREALEAAPEAWVREALRGSGEG